MVEGDSAKELAASVVDPERDVPIVIATPTRDERDGDLAPARARTDQLQRRLMGVAPVVLLGKGAVSVFSRAILEAGADLDVYGGSVRTYLPGTGSEGDWPQRHRYVPFHRLRGRPTDQAARLVSLPVIRSACQQTPPPAWRGGIRGLVGVERGLTDADLEQLVELAEREAAEANRQAEEYEQGKTEAEQHLELERGTVAEVLGESDKLRRRVRYLEEQLQAQGSEPEPLEDEVEIPDFCSEVVERVEESCDLLALGPEVKEAAESLDEHAEASWARKGWRAFQALQAYALAKSKEDGGGLNFVTFCERGEDPDVIPKSWVAPSESETTDSNPRFRELRTFSVPEEAVPDGRAYMPAHIKIEQGGYPAPRIHFYDDTEGSTGKVHIGWFGPHRDNKAKN